MSREIREILIVAVLAIFAITVLTGLFWVIPSYFEARAFNRVTGKSVSTWDAMWIDLRVQSSPNE